MLRLPFVIISLVAISAIAIANHPNRNSRAQSPAPAGQQSTNKGSITGRVICEEGQIPANLSITIWSPGNPNTQPQQPVIDESGRFQANNLVPASYIVNAYAPGYITPDTQSQRSYYRLGDNITIKIKKGGVITGTVTDAGGEPAVGVQVRAIRVRDAEGRRLKATQGGVTRPTDDRGVYRIYGLPEGSYKVAANSFFKSASSEVDVIASTYHPSSTRDAAVEVNVQSGEEVSNVDIRYRSERGYSVSGILTGTIGQSAGRGRIFLVISDANTGMTESMSSMLVTNNNPGFEVHGVPNGEYEVSVRSVENDGETASNPVRINVKNADVSGLEIKLAPLGSLTGRMILERLPKSDQPTDCKNSRAATITESIITTRRDLAKNEKQNPLIAPMDTVPDDKGEFKIKSFFQGRYRFDVRLPVESWYVRSMTMPATRDKTIDVSPAGVTFKQREKVAGLTITVSEGAASIRGKVASDREGASLPSQLRVHLIPAEPESAEDLLRYSQVNMQSDATFTLTNVAPGKYWIVVRTAIEDESGIEILRPAAWDTDMRKKLRLDGETTGAVIDLKSCQHKSDYLLRYAQPAAARPAKTVSRDE